MGLSVAVVGAGPAGFYATEALLNRRPDVCIDIIERLASPFGLVRAGVAPDHQSTKKVSHRFAGTAGHESVQFFGNVAVGSDVTVEELCQTYDAVVLAVGSALDRPLGIPGEHMQGVYGSAAFVGWYNGHPDFRDLNPSLDTTAAVVIGNGNVALDIARMLAKSPRELAATDTADYAGRAIAASPIRDVYLVGRRGPADARFTPAELREMGQLEASEPVVDGSAIPERIDDGDSRDRRLKEKNLAILRAFAGPAANSKPKRVHFVFHAAPVAICGTDRAETVRFERTRLVDGRLAGTGQHQEIRAGLVVFAIGYRASPIPGIAYDEERGLIANVDGRIGNGLYAVGWAKRGPTGVIASNRPDGELCADQICADVPSGTRPGRPALAQLLARRGVRPVTFDDWLRIDAAEVASASEPAPRRKFTSLDEMLAVIAERGRT